MTKPTDCTKLRDAIENKLNIEPILGSIYENGFTNQLLLCRKDEHWNLDKLIRLNERIDKSILTMEKTQC